MKGIMIGGRYKLVNHPYQPIGVAVTTCQPNQILVEWEDRTLIPPSDKYPEEMFVDGSFEFLGYASEDPLTDWSLYAPEECVHDWTTYTGLKDQYEYCKKCDIKKP